jgi:hypothetical protein
MRKKTSFLYKTVVMLLVFALTFSMAAPQISYAASNDGQGSENSKKAFIDEKVVTAFANDEYVSVLVVLNEQTDTERIALTAENNAKKQQLSSANSKKAKQHAVVNALQKTAEK